MKDKAKQIADIIIDTNTNDRGQLLRDIATELYTRSQGFTASLFKEIAETYGYRK